MRGVKGKFSSRHRNPSEEHMRGGKEISYRKRGEGEAFSPQEGRGKGGREKP